MTPAVRDDRPVVVRNRRFDPKIAHGWVRFDNGWIALTCAKLGEAFAPGDYEFLPAGADVTCMACLVMRKP